MSVACVVKLGGSQARSPLLRAWLQAISAAAGEVVVVPGGGPFADAVRAAQPVIGYSDRAAHRMALHAMAQFGIALASLGGFTLAETDQEIARALERREIPVWSPVVMLRDAPEVPESWSVTSDSLALWLAARLEARAVLLVKPQSAPPGATVADLVAHGTVDAAFPGFLARYGGALFVAGPDDVPAAGLRARQPPGVALRAMA